MPKDSVQRESEPLLRAGEALALGQLVQGSLGDAGIEPTLLVFFSVASVQSQRLMAYVRAWHERYAPARLQIVAIHTPELERTRSDSVLRVTAKRWGLDFPLMQDPDRKVWLALGNMGWNSCHVFDRDGKHLYTHPEGTSMRKIELDLQEVVRLPQPIRLLEPLFPEDAPGAVRLQPSEDLHLGYKLGAIANLEGFLQQTAVDYQPTEAAGSKPLLRGGWESTAECLISKPQAGQTSELELRANAKDVYILAEAKQAAKLKLEVNGASSEIDINELRLYPLVLSETLRPLHLRLQFENEGFQIYMLRFTTEAHKTRDVEDI